MGPGDAAGGWPMPPMPDWMRPMPGMHALRPDVAPWLPGAGVDRSTLPLARPREVLSLRNGDTLHLTAGLVRRTIAGRTLVMYGYNGQVPGPLLKVQQGATILVDFANAIDQPSAVHWHGIRLENRSDGAVGVTQAAVQPGERFLYRVHFRDAGIYWYHPHVREDSQQDLGLSGNILVAPNARDYWGRVNREEVLLLDDILLGDSAIVPYGREGPTHALSGRHGNVTLVNGAPRWTLDVKRGEVVRFHLTNAANARFFNVSFDSLPMKVVGTDVGRFEREVWAPNAVIAPAERYVVEVRFDTPGEVALVNRVQALDHMAGWFYPQVDTLGVVRVSDDAGDSRLARVARATAQQSRGAGRIRRAGPRGGAPRDARAHPRRAPRRRADRGEHDALGHARRSRLERRHADGQLVGDEPAGHVDPPRPGVGGGEHAGALALQAR